MKLSGTDDSRDKHQPIAKNMAQTTDRKIAAIQGRRQMELDELWKDLRQGSIIGDAEIFFCKYFFYGKNFGFGI